MSKYTLDQLQHALGKVFKIEPSHDGSMAQIQTKGDHNLGLIVFEEDIIEADLSCRWLTADKKPRGFSGEKDIAAARQEVVEKLLPDWETAGFRVDDDEPGGGIALMNPEAEDSLPIFKLLVVKDVPTLEDAVKTIQWMRTAEMETWA